MEPSKPDLSSPPKPINTSASQDIPQSPNPWGDNGTEKSSPDLDEKSGLSTPDPSTLDQSIVAGIGSLKLEGSEAELSAPLAKDVLNEFDPLEDDEEKQSREAWANSESHPPIPTTHETPPKPPSPSQTPVPKDAPPDTTNAVSPASSATFSSLAALARSFTLPKARSRPVSMDVAKPVPSPSTLSTFVAQQDEAAPAPTVTTPSRPITPQSALSASSDNEETPFDFQKFLDQMKTRSAEPVAKYLKSFLSNFAKRSFTISDQIRIINDFLGFIAKQMRDCDVWANASEVEFDNAMEGMEKLVMNQLYQFTFTPHLLRAVPPRQITTDDLERDRVLSQRTALFGWIEEKHLDIPEAEGSKGFLMFAEQELMKINHYKAPRDKLICILNCCKVIFGLIRHLGNEEGADSFVPLLIFVVLKANPENLLSNVEFINRFRNPDKLQSEAGYYLSSLMGAVSFIETMDHTSLSNISQEEFERNVEEAIQSLPASEASPALTTPGTAASFRPYTPSSASSHVGEESAHPLSLPAPTGPTFSDDAKRILQKTGDTISKPLNTISRIFNEALDTAESKLPTYLPGPFAPLELARESRQGGSRAGSPAPLNLNLQTPVGRGPADGLPQIQTPYKPRVRRVPSPSFNPNLMTPDSPGYSPYYDTPSRSAGPQTHQPLALGPSQAIYGQPPLVSPRVSSLAGYDPAAFESPPNSGISRTATPNIDMAGIQAQIDHANQQEAVASRDTLRQIFPTVEEEIIGWVLEANDNDLGRSIEALLEMSTAS